jgi:hypothetical protein
LAPFFTLAILGCLCGAALADMAPGRFPPRFPVRPAPFIPNLPAPVPVAPAKPVEPPSLIVQVADDLKDAKVAGQARPAKLQIPLEALQSLRAALDEVDGPKYAGLAPTNTIAAGCALALAISFGGLWLVRRGGEGLRKRGLVLAASAFVVLAAGSMTIGADADKPTKKKDIGDTVQIEIVKDKGAPVTLTISKSRLSRAMDEAK